MPAEVAIDELAASVPVGAPAAPWARLFSPSLSDLFFLFITAWLFLVSPLGWQRLLLDADTALHTRIGQYILSTGTVPHQDLFAFSKTPSAWYAFEWLSETAFAWLYGLAGWKGITLLAGALIALYLTVLLKYAVWKGANGLAAVMVTLMTATATAIHYHARPHLFTLLLLACAVWLLDYNRRHGGRLIWLLVPLTALWANLHGGFFIFLVLLALRTAACAGEAWMWPDIRPARQSEVLQLALLGAACGLASLVNPYGWHLHAHILETLRSSWITANVSEFKSPTFRTEEMYHFMVLLFAGLALLPSLVRKKNLVEPLWILFLAYCSLTSVRHLTIYLLVATPIIAQELSTWWSEWVAGRSGASLPAMLNDVSQQLTSGLPGTSLFIPAVIVTLACLPGLHWPQEFPEAAVPAKMIERHAGLLANGRVFASDQIADYLIFRNYPSQRVFFDSRHNYYGEKIGNDYLTIEEGQSKWRSVLDSYGFNLILTPVNSPISSLAQAAGGWRVIENNSKYILFERQ